MCLAEGQNRRSAGSWRLNVFILLTPKFAFLAVEQRESRSPSPPAASPSWAGLSAQGRPAGSRTPIARVGPSSPRRVSVH